MGSIFYFNLLVFGIFFGGSEAANCNATSDVTSLTLNKFVKTFKALVIKFDTAYPYGEKHEEFCRFAIEAADVNDVFVGEVGMKDYGDRENMDFAKHYGIEGRDPAILLIYTTPDGEVRHERFHDLFNVEKIRAFTYQYSRVYVPRSGCVHVFDVLALKFMALKDPKTREVVLKEAKKESQSQSESGRYYIKIMDKLLTEDNSFIQSEADRLNKILKTTDKISEEKKTLMIKRLNILRSFNVDNGGKDEL